MEKGKLRIRRLRLASSDTTLLAPARFRLEEAFRLASLPGLPPNALVLIRHLDLGRFRADLPPWLLAGRIENLVRELGGRAVCVDRQGAGTSPVVWFSDPLQPFVALMTRLLDNRPATEWYWQTLFAGNRLAPDSACIEMLLAGAAATPLKALGQALLLQHCLAPAQRRRDRLFSLLTGPMAVRLLHGLGLTPAARGDQARQQQTRQPDNAGAAHGQPAAPSGPDMPGPTPGPTAPSLETAFRSEPIPAPELSLAWRTALQCAARRWGAPDVRCLWLAYHALLCHQPAYLSRPDTLQRLVPSDWLAQWSPAGPHGVSGGPAATVAMASAGKSPQTAAHGKPAAWPGSTHGAADARKAADVSAVPFPSPAVRVPGGKPLPVQRPGTDSPAPPPPAAAVQKLSSALVREEWAGTFSSQAGFALLIPLLARLGMADLLARHERLTALDFPGRVLAAIARRCGLAADDPCRDLFAKPASTDNPVVERFRAPAAWWRLAAAGGRRPLRRLQIAESGRRVITAPGGRWLLAVDDASAAIHDDAEREYAVDDGGTLRQPVRFDDLVRATQLAAGVYLRRCCAMSCRTLLRRPGRVVLTSTHWDVIFDLNRTDLRLRRVALDSDPGWVVWLGKVVQFHYL